MKILYLNYYVDNNPERQKEIDKCLDLNFQNPLIDMVVLIVDRSFDEIIFDSKSGKDVLVSYLDSRPTYSDFFKLMADHSAPDDINILANSDIFFDDSLALLDKICLDKKCLAITRYNVTRSGKVVFEDNSGSQDVWIFKGPPEGVNGNFKLGKRGCDNRIAYEIEKAGYQVYNPIDIITYHLHITNIRNYSTKGDEDKVQPPYRFVDFCKAKRLFKNPPKRILHIALNAPNSPQTALRKALEGMGEYLEIDWMYIRDKYGIAFLRNYIIEKSRYFRPDLTFMQIQTPGIIDSVIAEQIPGIVINWTGDVRQPIPEWYLEVGKAVDFTCFTNEHDVEVFHSKGLPAAFLNIGFEDSIYTPDGPKLKGGPEIVFLGSHYGMEAFPLSRYRYEMVHALRKEFGTRFACYGSGWDFPTSFVKPKEEAVIYRSCKVAINCSHFDLERYSSDRIFRIMGSGAACISHRYKGFEKDFESMSGLTFSTIQELIHLIHKCLDNPDEFEIRGAMDSMYIHVEHTWSGRVEQLKQLIGWTEPVTI